MKLIIEYSIHPDQRNSSGKRFLETGGGPPAGVTMLGRWHKVGGLGGYVLCETSDAEAAANWCAAWTDLLSFNVTPVLDDEQTGRVLAKVVS